MSRKQPPNTQRFRAFGLDFGRHSFIIININNKRKYFKIILKKCLHSGDCRVIMARRLQKICVEAGGCRVPRATAKALVISAEYVRSRNGRKSNKLPCGKMGSLIQCQLPNGEAAQGSYKVTQRAKSGSTARRWLRILKWEGTKHPALCWNLA